MLRAVFPAVNVRSGLHSRHICRSKPGQLVVVWAERNSTSQDDVEPVGDQPVLVRFRRDTPLVIGEVAPESMADIKRMTAFGDQVISAISNHKGIALLLNFEKVAYLSSAALTELIRIRETVRGNGGALRLSGLSQDIYKIFEITKLDGDFSVRPKESPAESVARFKQDIASSPAAQRAARPSQG